MLSVKEMPVVTVEQIVRFQSTAKKIEGQRDQLLEALKDARYALYGDGPGNPKIDAAIAAVENT